MINYNYTDLTNLQPVDLNNTTMQLTGLVNGTQPVNLTATGTIHVISQVQGIDLVFYALVLIAVELMPIAVYAIRRMTPRPKE